VLAAAFDEAIGRWLLTRDGGAEHEADVLITATGQLSRPSTPDVPGLDSFQGALFHSGHWDHAHDVRVERVAVLGTGAGDRPAGRPPHGLPVIDSVRNYSDHTVTLN
jgi:cation diffusion facilitator CzcD-associated flavoprotein CzcO